ncbi:MAG: Gfo/Idh/MocA family oxidoreductase [Patescibacteria group bacterium]
MKNNQKILLVGTGPMALEYAKVLKSLKQNIVVIGRGNESANAFKKATNLEVIVGGITKWLKENKDYPKKAIVAVSENEIGNVTIELLKSGFKDILVEKPGGFDYQQIQKVANLAQKKQAKVYVGYNRRFYASTIAAEKIIKKDGGVTSFNFEFTEWSHVIADLKKAPGVKEEWFLHNSTHVIDLAFFLGGDPEKISAYTAGGLNWHPRASIFVGSGKAKNGALFSYQANWESPGRWSVEILTKKHRLIFRPMEKLQIQNIGSVAIDEVAMDEKLDNLYKPGLYRQVDAFLSNQTKKLCSIKEQVKNIEFYKIIGGIAK